jgi:AmiR/NasT family two-component response regulator
VGRHQQLADALGGQASEAVTNADLSFSTRLDAAAAPQQMRDRIEIETATGLLAARSGTDLEGAQRLLREAAVRAGVPAALVARVLVLVHRGWPSP